MSNMGSTASLKLWCFLDDKESEAFVKSLPLSEYNITAEFYQGGIHTAIPYIKENRSPDILIVDISKSQMHISDIAALSDVCEPGVEVIVVGEKNDVGIFRDLVKSGVHDYFVKPLPKEHLLKSIVQICIGDNMSEPAPVNFSKTGKIVTLIGAVGGSGVSTITSNLGCILSDIYSKRTSIADFDLQLGTISQFLDLDPSQGFSQLFESPDRIDSVLVERYLSFYSQNLGILSAQFDINEIPRIKLEAIDSLLNILSTNFHFTLIDLPRNFTNDLNLHVFKRSSVVIIVTDYSIVGLKDTKRYLDLLRSYPSLKQNILIVANKVGLYEEGEIDRATFEEALQQSINFEISFDKRLTLKALTEGIPLAKSQEGPVISGVIEITNYLLGIQTEKTNTPNLFHELKKKILSPFSKDGV